MNQCYSYINEPFVAETPKSGSHWIIFSYGVAITRIITSQVNHCLWESHCILLNSEERKYKKILFGVVVNDKPVKLISLNKSIYVLH